MIIETTKKVGRTHTKKYREELREYDTSTKKLITDKYSIATQINALRRAILTGELDELKLHDEHINNLLKKET